MTDAKIDPNPYSPYANADPEWRHLIPSLFGLVPEQGVLCLTACDRMAVAPEEALREATDGLIGAEELPDGLCPSCVAMAKDGQAPVPARPQECRECGGLGSQGAWCALCRQELHEAWWPTRSENGGEVSAR
ncbi:hypothetical protein [Streptomyces sp.]|jgi:hypothetical protein|uniref:hypothetical protein n=1 Tax=Streptomyces sp. TaxID=1931 RepID=UPI002F93CE6B